MFIGCVLNELNLDKIEIMTKIINLVGKITELIMKTKEMFIHLGVKS